MVMIVILLILAAGFVALIKYPQLYNTAQEFEGFEADATQRPPPDRQEGGNSRSELDALRVAEYERNRGLFLTHAWRPSEKPGEVADVVIRLQEHRDTSTRQSVLRDGLIDSVRYELGSKFSDEPFVKRDPDGGFALDVSAYRPMLCLAEVTFNDGHPTVHLSRYIDFRPGS